MRLGTLSTLLIVLGLALSACGGESVEDRARALKAAQKPPPAPASSLEPGSTPSREPSSLDTQPAPKPTGSSSAAPVPTPVPQKP